MRHSDEPRIKVRQSGGGVTDHGDIYEEIVKGDRLVFAVTPRGSWNLKGKPPTPLIRGQPRQPLEIEFKDKIVKTESETLEIHTVPYAENVWPYPGEPKPPESVEALHEGVRRFIYDHCDLPDDRLYSIAASWVLASWVPELWDTAGYLFFLGSIESGKTRALETLSKVSYRGMMSSNLSTPVLFRMVSKYGPTVFLDETEQYNKDTRADIQNLLNSGYKRGLPAMRMRMVEGEESEIEFFNVFGPKALAGTDELLRSLESRSIPIKMMRATRPVAFLIDEERARDLRSRLLYWRWSLLTDASDASDASDAYRGEAPTALSALGSGRLIEIFAASWAVSEKGRDAIMSYCRDLVESRAGEDEASLEAEVTEAICSIRGKVKAGQFTTADVAAALNDGRDPLDQLKVMSVGRVIKRLGFTKKRVQAGNKTIAGFVWEEGRLRRHAQRYNIPVAISGFKEKTPTLDTTTPYEASDPSDASDASDPTPAVGGSKEAPRATLAEQFDQVAKVFADNPGPLHPDFIASRLGVPTEDAEKPLKALEREGRAFHVPGSELWRWQP